jgi:aspartate-semialdehyde dehydrogenase
LEKIKVGIMGCTGLVGQQFIRMLENHPYFEVAALSASSKSVGKRFYEAVDWITANRIPEEVKNITLAEIDPQTLKRMGIQVLFSALPSDVAKEMEKKLAQEGFYIFSNAGAFRMDKNVPIVIPEVNPEHFDLIKTQSWCGGGFIVTNSNCATTGLVLGLKPLFKFGLKSVTVTTFQALSGAGRRGLASLDILGNVIPYIKDEEDKIEREVKKIFGQIRNGSVHQAPMEIIASCCRVPTRDGHLESILVETEADPDIETVLKAFYLYQGIPQKMALPSAPEKPIILVEKPDRPQPRLDTKAGYPERARGMAVTIGRVRKKGQNKINFFLLVHNTIRGAAGTCILNAEYAVMSDYIQKNKL